MGFFSDLKLICERKFKMLHSANDLQRFDLIYMKSFSWVGRLTLERKREILLFSLFIKNDNNKHHKISKKTKDITIWNNETLYLTRA